MLTSDPTMVAIVNNVKLACETAGGEAVFENWDFTPDALVTASEKLINEGVDGLILAAPSSSVIPYLLKCVQTQKSHLLFRGDISLTKRLRTSSMHALIS